MADPLPARGVGKGGWHGAAADAPQAAPGVAMLGVNCH